MGNTIWESTNWTSNAAGSDTEKPHRTSGPEW